MKQEETVCRLSFDLQKVDEAVSIAYTVPVLQLTYSATGQSAHLGTCANVWYCVLLLLACRTHIQFSGYEQAYIACATSLWLLPQVKLFCRQQLLDKIVHIVLII